MTGRTLLDELKPMAVKDCSWLPILAKPTSSAACPHKQMANTIVQLCQHPVQKCRSRQSGVPCAGGAGGKGGLTECKLLDELKPAAVKDCS